MKAFNKLEPYNDLPNLPTNTEFESVEILKKVIEANKFLAELKGYCKTLPNPHLLLNTIVLQESKDSSEIENIVTTQDELYKATLALTENQIPSAAKEVLLYRQAIYKGVELMNKKGVITTNLMVAIMQELKDTDAGIRNTIGTKLANPSKNEVIYTPPEGENLIREKLKKLEDFLNDDEKYNVDPLIKMALMHYQFEAIHPFADGNGRTGRILNVLFLMNKNLLPLPILYLSSYIIKNKNQYYTLLRKVTEEQNWHDWLMYMLQGIAETAKLTLQKVDAIQKLKAETELKMKALLKTSYSKEFSDLLFSNPYIKIKTVEASGIAKRQTASQYLQVLATANILTSIKVGKELYYINHQLMNIFKA